MGMRVPFPAFPFGEGVAAATDEVGATVKIKKHGSDRAEGVKGATGKPPCAPAGASPCNKNIQAAYTPKEELSGNLHRE